MLLEAGAAGLPAICTEACGSAIEAVRDLYCGQVISSGDPPALVRAMKWTHEHYQQLPEFGRRAQEIGRCLMPPKFGPSVAPACVGVC